MTTIDGIEEAEVIKKLTPFDKQLTRPTTFIMGASADLANIWADVNDYFLWNTLDLLEEKDRGKIARRINEFEELAALAFELDNQFRNGFFFSLSNLLKLKHQIPSFPETPETLSRKAFEESWERNKKLLKEVM